MDKNILPGVGIGNLNFGLFMSDVKNILGERNRSERYSYSDNNEDLTETWFYSNLGLDFGFDQEDNWKLCLITVESENYKLFESICIGTYKVNVI